MPEVEGHTTELELNPYACLCVQMMPKDMDPKAKMRYDRGREGLDQSAVNFLIHDKE